MKQKLDTKLSEYFQKKKFKVKKLGKPKSLEKSLKINYIKCHEKNDISKITERNKQIVLNYYKNLSSRESHYSPKTERNRKYLSSDLNKSKRFKNFIELFSEYKGLISYDFFHHYFKSKI